MEINLINIIIFLFIIATTVVITAYVVRQKMKKKIERKTMKAELSYQQKITDLKGQLNDKINMLQNMVNKLELSNRELNNIEEIKSKFMSIVAHDLKQPLSSIQGFTSVLLDAEDEKNNENQILKSIMKATENMNKLISDLVDISVIESGALKMNLQPFDYNKLVMETFDLLSVQANKKGIKFLKYDYPSVITVKGDRLRISQILNNIISNAIKFTPSSGQVSVRYQIEGDYVKTFVKDTGPGISYEERERVFEKFHQLENPDRKSKKQGWGLGLCIASELVKAHGGAIDFESAGQGRGTTFSFSLPLSK